MIRELLKLTARPEIISFAGGLPAPELFPVEEFQAATEPRSIAKRLLGAAIQHHRRLYAVARISGGQNGCLWH